MSVSVSAERETERHTDRDTDGQRRTHRLTEIDSQKDTETRIHRHHLDGVLRARASGCVFVCMCVANKEVHVACCVVVTFVFCVVAVCFLSCLGSNAFVRDVCMTRHSAHCTCVLPLTRRRTTYLVPKIRFSTIAFRDQNRWLKCHSKCKSMSHRQAACETQLEVSTGP